MGVIYKITNTINNKIYIGQTVITEPKRWQQHIWYAKNDPNKDCVILCNAIRKYGAESFKREIIETVDNNLLNKQEQYWINYYNSCDKEIGYNISLGGEGCCKYSDEQILQTYVDANKNIAQAASISQISKETLSHRLQSMGIITRPDTPIEQYTLTGELIQTYETVAVASRETGIGSCIITDSKNKTAGGYIWKRQNDPTPIKEYVAQLSRFVPGMQAIEQYSLDGIYIQTYTSAAEASNITKINISSIKQAALGNQISAGNYLWRRAINGQDYDDMVMRYIASRRCCNIDEIDEQGNVIKTFESSNKAEIFYGLSYNEVKRVCDGIKKHARNHYFQYSNARKRELIKIHKQINMA